LRIQTSIDSKPKIQLLTQSKKMKINLASVVPFGNDKLCLIGLNLDLLQLDKSGHDMRVDTFTAWCLGFGGIGNLLGALLHIVVLIGGPKWIAFVGAPAWAVRSAREGTWIAPVGALSIAALLTAWGLYAFSAVGWFRPLPFVKPVLGLIAVIFIVRGAIILPLLARVNWSSPIDQFVVTSSLFIFALGVAYGVGLWGVLRAN
jgi:hypothetical protein